MTSALSPQSTDFSGTVYLIHLQRPYHHARHYLGWTMDVERRLALHRAGGGSPLLRAAVAAGISFEVARTWSGDRHLERRLHRYKNDAAQLCPICRGKAKWRAEASSR